MTDMETAKALNEITNNFEFIAAWSALTKKDIDLAIRIYESVKVRLVAAITSPEVEEDRRRRETERAMIAANLTGDELKLVNEINSCGSHVVVANWARNMVQNQIELYRKIFPAIKNRYFQAVDSDEWRSYIAAGANLGES